LLLIGKLGLQCGSSFEDLSQWPGTIFVLSLLLALAFASDNAGPTRIAKLPQQAAEQGLDPNKWFGNVELMVAKDIGQETVTYVGNVHKYNIAYKLALGKAQVHAPS
jgi:membrane-bound lytic murein transglycosylase MltF